VLLKTLTRHDAEGRDLHTRLVEVGSMAGADLVLPAAVLRSAGLEIVGMGTGTVGGREHFATAIREFYGLLRTGAIRVDIERVPLDQVAETWHREQGGRRPVLIP
jgi:NADPH:quinone reductase-like Zn-dependent oxidoreductase